MGLDYALYLLLLLLGSLTVVIIIGQWTATGAS